MAWRLLACALVLLSLTACAVNQSANRSGGGKPNHSPITTSSPEDICLTLSWNGERVFVPAPAPYPHWVKGAKGYQAWRRIGNIQAFETVDDQGRRVVATLLGIEQRPDGSRHELVGSVATYHPAGDLWVVTLMMGQDNDGYRTVTILDRTQTKIMDISVCVDKPSTAATTPTLPTWRVWHVTHYNTDSSKLWWDVDESGTVTSETKVDPDGRQQETRNRGTATADKAGGTEH